jgi:hypothetical protein
MMPPVNQFPMRLGESMNYGVPQRDPAQPDFMQKFVQILMQLRNAPPQQAPGGQP